MNRYNDFKQLNDFAQFLILSETRAGKGNQPSREGANMPDDLGMVYDEDYGMDEDPG